MNLLNEIWRIKALPTYVNFAGYYCILKEKEKALTFLEKAMEEHNPSIPEINADAVYDILRAEPRFLALIDQMGLAPYHRLPPR